jgi:hypothetical protein
VSCPTCHGPSKFQGRRDKTFVSLLGEVVLRDRAYYLCPACHAGHVPVDAALGFSARRLTKGAEELATLAGTVGSFADAVEKFLPRMSGLRLGESTVERTTEEAGRRLGELWGDGHTLGSAADWHWNHDAKGKTVAYVSIDATGIGIQGEGAAQAEGRMAWVGKIYNPAASPTEAFPKPHPPSARYLAGLASLADLGEPLRNQAAQVGMDRAQQWVAVTDCGSGVEEFLRVNFPRAQRIADFFHVAEHLGDLAKAWHLGDAEAAQDQADRWCHTLKHEGGRAILAELEALDRTERPEAVVEVHRHVRQYLENHADRMDYPTYLASGWQIGSGHIEAACKTVVNQRLKLSGMRWGCDGADAVCHLRALYEGESSQWDAFWERSIN